MAWSYPTFQCCLYLLSRFRCERIVFDSNNFPLAQLARFSTTGKVLLWKGFGWISRLIVACIGRPSAPFHQLYIPLLLNWGAPSPQFPQREFSRSYFVRHWTDYCSNHTQNKVQLWNQVSFSLAIKKNMCKVQTFLWTLLFAVVSSFQVSTYSSLVVGLWHNPDIVISIF